MKSLEYRKGLGEYLIRLSETDLETLASLIMIPDSPTPEETQVVCATIEILRSSHGVGSQKLWRIASKLKKKLHSK